MATIRQVASHAGVSIGTVSKVLNGRDERVDPVTREKILASIRALRYKPPAFEVNQKATIANNLGMIVPDMTGSPLRRQGYIQALLDGVLERAAMRGWSVTIFADTMWDDVGNAVRRKYDGRCDGLIIVAPQPDRDIVPSLHRRGAPLVQVGSTPWLDDISSVDIDNYEAGRMIARHFQSLGHENIGFVTDRREQVSSLERSIGFLEVAGANGTKFMIEREEGVAGFADRFAGMGGDRPTALMTWHDGMAFRLIPELERVGIRVPEDLSMAGVDNSSEAEQSSIRLTTIDNPIVYLGQMAADMAIDRVLDRSVEAAIVKLAPELIVGDSTRLHKR
jgi:DNA-binding LacI/PurR family transcriptional regulator